MSKQQAELTAEEQQYKEFWEWVDQLRKKAPGGSMSWRQIEALGGLSNGALSRRVKYHLSPTISNCEAVAKALHMALRDVLIKAGLIDIPYMVDQIQDADFKTVLAMMRDLKPERRKQVVDYVAFLLDKQRDQDGA